MSPNRSVIYCGYRISRCLSGCLVFHAPRLGHSSGGVEDLERYQIADLVIIENHARLVLVAFRDGDSFLEHEAERIRPPVVRNSHCSFLQYLSSFVVRYTVTTRAGRRSISKKTRTRYPFGGDPSAIRDCRTTRPPRTGNSWSGDVTTCLTRSS